MYNKIGYEEKQLSDCVADILLAGDGYIPTGKLYRKLVHILICAGIKCDVEYQSDDLVHLVRDIPGVPVEALESWVNVQAECLDCGCDYALLVGRGYSRVD